MNIDPSTFNHRCKIYLPQVPGINYVGLIIGPKGTFQKKLEEQTGCKILIRGKNSHKDGYPPQPDDNEEQHILILSDQESKIKLAKTKIEEILRCDEQQRQQIRMDQLREASELSQRMYVGTLHEHLLTPYGPPSPHAYIIPVPNECVGLIIGKSGDTIRNLQLKSGARIQVAKKSIPNTTKRNVFIEGSVEKFEKAKRMVDEIVEEHRKLHTNFQSLIAGSHPLIKKDETQNNTYIPDRPVGLDQGQQQQKPLDLYQQQQHNIGVQQTYPSYQMPQFIPQQNHHMTIEQQRKAFQHHYEQCQLMHKQLEVNSFPGPHTFVSIPNECTAFIIGFNNERINKLHQQTGAYIFIPKDYNALSNERIIQLSGNEKAVQMCKEEIKRIVREVAPHLNIDLDEFKATKKVVEDKFKQIMRNQQHTKKSLIPQENNDPKSVKDERMKGVVKNEQQHHQQQFMDQHFQQPLYQTPPYPANYPQFQQQQFQQYPMMMQNQPMYQQQYQPAWMNQGGFMNNPYMSPQNMMMSTMSSNNGTNESIGSSAGNSTVQGQGEQSQRSNSGAFPVNTMNMRSYQ